MIPIGSRTGWVPEFPAGWWLRLPQGASSPRGEDRHHIGNPAADGPFCARIERPYQGQHGSLRDRRRLRTGS
jgi:hypothetical protein